MMEDRRISFRGLTIKNVLFSKNSLTALDAVENRNISFPARNRT
jgi:hypothetical protein